MSEVSKLDPVAWDEKYLTDLLHNDRIAQQINFILEVDKLKQVLRMTPLLDASRRENDAEHTWELALMAIVLSEYTDEPIDISRALKILIIHDIVEIDAGDSFIYDEVAQKDQEKRERAAAERIFGLLPHDQSIEFRELWNEFEARSTPEARFARAMDRLQPLLHNFFTSGGTWHSGGVTKLDVLERKSPIGRSSLSLWNAAQSLIDEGVKRGFLVDGPRTEGLPDA